MLIENVLVLSYVKDKKQSLPAENLYGYDGNVLVVGCEDTTNGENTVNREEKTLPYSCTAKLQ
jgi:hypothetical protein